MKIRVLSGVILNGEPRDVGSIVEVSDFIGRQIISSNRAEAYVEPQSEPQAEAPAKPSATRASK